jgi:tetratricopeptide (TPR) repeat protein
MAKKPIQIAKIERANDINAYMAEAYFQLKDYEKSMSFYKALLDTGHKFMKVTITDYGYTLFKNGQYQQAISIFQISSSKKMSSGKSNHFMMGTPTC